MEILHSLLSHDLLVSLSKTLLHFVWQGILLAVVLYQLLRSIDQKYSRARYLLGLAALAMNVLFPVITFLYFHQNATPINLEQATSVLSSITSEATSSQWLSDWNFLLPTIALSWLVGVCWLSVQLIYQVYRINQLPNDGTSRVEKEIEAIFERLTAQLNANAVTRLMISTKADVPMVIGWLRPIVLVPASMIVGLSPAQLEMLLAHELAHVKRHDYLVNFFQTLIEILFFFHPCVKWVSNQVRIEREYCCDDIAVNCCGNPTAYARALTEAELIRANIPELAMAATGGDLKKRVFRLVNKHDCSAKHSESWLSTMIAGATGLGLALFLIASSHMATAKLNAKALPVNTVVKAEFKQDTETEIPEPSHIIPEENLPSPIDDIEEAETQQAAQLEQETIDPPVSMESELAHLPTEEPPHTLVQEDKVEAIISAVEEEQSANKELEPDLAEYIESLVSPDSVMLTSHVELGSEPSSMISSTIQPVVQTSSINKPLVEEIQTAQEKYEPTVILPKVVRGVVPRYPNKAIHTDFDGRLNVTFTVNSKGRVEDPVFEEGVHKHFQRAVKFALKKWRYEAGTIDGEKQPMKVTRTFSFPRPREKERFLLAGSRLTKVRYVY
jgi:TonB family protein